MCEELGLVVGAHIELVLGINETSHELSHLSFYFKRTKPRLINGIKISVMNISLVSLF